MLLGVWQVFRLGSFSTRDAALKAVRDFAEGQQPRAGPARPLGAASGSPPADYPHRGSAHPAGAVVRTGIPDAGAAAPPHARPQVRLCDLSRGHDCALPPCFAVVSHAATLRLT